MPYACSNDTGTSAAIEPRLTPATQEPPQNFSQAEGVPSTCHERPYFGSP